MNTDKMTTKTTHTKTVATKTTSKVVPQHRHYYLCLDASGSMSLNGKHAAMAQGVALFLKEVLRERDRVTIFSFNRSVTVHASAARGYELSAGDRGVQQIVDGLDCDGLTALYGCVRKALGEAKAYKRRHRNAVTEVIVFSDGKDTMGDGTLWCSGGTPAIAAARSRGTTATASRLSRHAVGDRVAGNYQCGGTWYRGAVTRTYDDGTVDIRFDDGDTEASVAASRVRAEGDPRLVAYPSLSEIKEQLAHPGFQEANVVLLGVGEEAGIYLPRLAAKGAKHVHVIPSCADDAGGAEGVREAHEGCPVSHRDGHHEHHDLRRRRRRRRRPGVQACSSCGGACRGACRDG
jgi:hypothetical protein